jgi:hypothetical protein
MNTNNRRPETWTSADAAGLAIFPGLVRYDEAWNSAIADIGHAFRVTVRATNGYVYPASHRAGSTSGALPMGARLRLKTNVGGADPALRTADPNVRKIFRAMQKYGVIVADNGSDMYITGTFDRRWSNDVLNPAFATLSASDFDVIELGWKPIVSGTPALSAVGASPSQVTGGTPSTGTITLTSAAPAGGTNVSLSSASSAVAVPASVTVPQGGNSATFGITTLSVTATTSVTLSASYAGVTKTTTVTVNPAPPPPPTTLATLTFDRPSIVGGNPVTGTVTLSAAAPSGGSVVALKSSNASLAPVPASVNVAGGGTSTKFAVNTAVTKNNSTVTISATYNGVTKTATITVKRR